ncbi:hypothetical protein Tco_0335147 [Tanacetum coccineum]
MEKSSLQIPQQELNPQQQDPQEEQPESSIQFEPVTQVEFNLDEITFNDNNEIALLYPSHTNSKYFKSVSDFISKCCLREAFTRFTNQYKEYLFEFWYTSKALKNLKVWFSTPTRGILGEVGVKTFRNAIGAHYLSHFIEYVATPPLETIRAWFWTIRYSGEIRDKGTLRKSCLPPR